MCGRYSLIQDLGELALCFGFEPGGLSLAPRYNQAPGQEGLVVVAEAEGRRGRLMRWGLIPRWADKESVGYKMINARAETVFDKPAYKELIARRRCLVPADGFYEWPRLKGKKTKRPYRFTRADGQPFAMAGLWTIWSRPEGGEVASYTIITTKANALVRPIHDRMPVILEPDNESAWLDDDRKGPARLARLLIPLSAEAMAVNPVSPLLNSPANDGPEVLEPEKPPTQASMFPEADD